MLAASAVCCMLSCKQPVGVQDGDEKSGLHTIPELIVYNKTPDTLLQHLPDYLTKHIPKGYAVLDTCSADLNTDGIQDFFLVTHKLTESLKNRTQDRSLKILLGKGDGTYQAKCESRTVLPSLEVGGFTDPYPGVIAGKSRFVIQFLAGSNRKQSFATTFEYSAADKDWIQIQEIQESYFMDKQEYKADTTTPKQFGRITFKKDCCKRYAQ